MVNVRSTLLIVTLASVTGLARQSHSTVTAETKLEGTEKPVKATHLRPIPGLTVATTRRDLVEVFPPARTAAAALSRDLLQLQSSETARGEVTAILRADPSWATVPSGTSTTVLSIKGLRKVTASAGHSRIRSLTEEADARWKNLLAVQRDHK